MSRRFLLPIAAVAVLTPPLFAALLEVAWSPARDYPVADQALLELKVEQATHGEEQLGAYSRFGWNHPGPLAFYLAAPGYALGQRTTTSLYLLSALWDFAMLALAMAIWWRSTRRRDHRWALVLATAVLGLGICVGFEQSVYSEIWNPALTMTPLWALLVASTAVLFGRRHWLAVAVFLHAFLVQTHLATVVAATVALLLAAGATARDLREQEKRRSATRTLALATAVGMLCWSMPIAEAISNDGGNFARLLAWAAEGDSARDPSRWLAAAERFCAPLPEVLTALGLPEDAVPGLVWVTLALMAPIALVVVSRSAWRSDALRRAVVVSAMAQLAGALVAIMSLRGPASAYLLLWLMPVAALFWLGLLAASAGLRERVGTRMLTNAATGIVAVSVAGQLFSTARFPPVDDDTAVQAAQCLVGRTRPERVRLELMGPDGWRLGAGLGLAVSRLGITPELPEGEAYRFGSAFRYQPAAEDPHVPTLTVWDWKPDPLRPLGQAGHGLITADFVLVLGDERARAFLGPGWSEASGPGQVGRAQAAPRTVVDVAVFPSMAHQLDFRARCVGEPAHVEISFDQTPLGEVTLTEHWSEHTFEVPAVSVGAEDHQLVFRATRDSADLPEVDTILLSPVIPPECADARE